MKKQTAINTGFLLSLVFLGMIVFLSHSLFDEFTIKDKEEYYVYNLVVQLDDLLRSLKDESDAQRVCLASGSAGDLIAYREAVSKVDLRVDQLQQLTRQRELYRRRLAAVALLVDRRHKILAGGLERGVRDPASKELIRQIRDDAHDLKKAALNNLMQSSSLQERSLHRIKLLMMAKTVIVALLFSSIFLLLRKDIAKRARKQEVLTAHRDRLDELVSLRTEELQRANEQLRSEMEVRKAAERSLHNLNNHMEQIREEERLAISRDIHDEIGQSLTALKLDLAWLEHKFLPGDAEFGARLGTMRSFLDRLIAKAQNIISELRPPLLDSLGLREAIEWQVREFRRRNGIICDLTIDGNFKAVQQKLATAVVRILMEALTNVSRHAGATAVRVVLRREGGDMVLEVSDDGRGLSTDNISAPTSFGLMGMRERALLCDGELTLSGRPEKGTMVLLRVPLLEPEAA
jgi:signal transduction histidine kinase